MTDGANARDMTGAKKDRSEYARTYYLLNSERNKAYQREYYKAHREQCISKVKECVRKRVEIEKAKLIEKRYEVQQGK